METTHPQEISSYEIIQFKRSVHRLNTTTRLCFHSIFFRHNSLNHIPKLIKQFYKLHRLDISHNAIATLDEIFDDLEVLVELHLAYNRITTLSKPFFKKLHNLRVILASSRALFSRIIFISKTQLLGRLFYIHPVI